MMKIPPALPSKLRFGAIKLTIPTASKEKKFFDTLNPHFPRGTHTDTNDAWSNYSAITITGPLNNGQQVEDRIARALRAVGLKIDVTPFQLDAEDQAKIDAGLKILWEIGPAV
jgi:hypothetical protein